MSLPVTRRQTLQGLLAGAALGGTAPSALAAPVAAKLTRAIPATGERIPAVGMGTWITFNVGQVEPLRRQRTEVLRSFFDHGGGMIDSSPMYGSAEDVLGDVFRRLGATPGLFAASKVWTGSDSEGVHQLEDSFRLWGINRFGLMQVHNLVNWQAHLPMLAEAKQEGRIRYVGLSTSHGLRHEEMARLMSDERVDFVQLTYNIVDREAEDRLLPMAADLGKAIIVNRPFQRGALTQRLEGKPLPPWAGELGMTSWAQFLLKFIISHPAVTCAIPATSKVAHMNENMRALEGPMPDTDLRAAMVDYVRTL